MYLKSLTMKGFKSFADPTTLDLEPGVTVIVGPNGSGKSNVVDAVAWVLGAQGPSIVRSQKMDDVIFAGTASRPALGRAEVTLVIDNSSRRLPADLNEVTIRRTIFRNGDSEYALNGVECRLLDVQELLSDGGVGRQQHSIISQGQLDSILSARPEDRRIAIEEAAGILKYRRRRERAVRRLEAAQGSLVRLGDLLREVRRQMRPLERQAASAERYGELAAELRELTLSIAAEDLRTMRLEQAEASASLKARDAEATSWSDRLDALDRSIAASEERLGRDPADRLVPLLGRVDRLDERSRGIAAILAARERSGAALIRALDEAAGVASLSETRDRLRLELDETEETSSEIARGWARLSEEEADLVAAEALHSETFQDLSHRASELAAVRRAEIARREQARALAVRQRDAIAERLVALGSRRALYTDRARTVEEKVATIEPELASARSALLSLDAKVAEAEEAHSGAEQQLASAREERAGLEARTEALGLALEQVRARSGAERLGDLPGVLGSLVDLVEVDERLALAFEAAVAAALDATVCADEATARAAVAALRGASEPGSVLVARRATPGRPSRTRLPFGAVWLSDNVRVRRPDLDGLLDDLVGGVAVVDGDLDAALALLGVADVDTVVTTDGDLFSPRGWRVQAGRAGATLDAYERASSELEAHLGVLARLEHADTVARATLGEARSAVREATANVARLESDLQTAMSELAECATLLEVLGADTIALDEQLAEADATCAGLDRELETERSELLLAEEAATDENARSDGASQARAQLDERARALAALRRDLEVRSASLEERRGQLLARVDELSVEIDRRNLAIVDAGAQRDALEREAGAIVGLVRSLERARGDLDGIRGRLGAEDQARRTRAGVALDQIASWRVERDGLSSSLERSRTERQRLEIELAQLAVREEAAIDALRRELDVEPADALARAQPVEIGATERRAALEGELRQLGPVNLLAKEELDALSERSGFLEHQIEDAQRASKELNAVIRAVDTEITEVFAAAFDDVSRNFALLVATLFPGGSGQLTLTAPDDLLDTGVEIEARPAGRTIRRLSLLSGGERSLVALAFLFAIFRSRPSPFYLMDEVEAALDEVNLVRFLALLEEFRDEAQLLVVSHQKRTMEIADALYGVTLQPGGASKVVSERLRSAPGAVAQRTTRL